KRVKTVLSTETDDRGEYRFYFLTPGAYYVSAGGGSIWNPDFPSFATGGGGVFATDLLTPSPVDPPFLTAPPGIANRSLQNFTLTFYPGVPDVASAAAIGVTAGSDLAGIDFSVTPQRDHTVRGLVIDDASGRPPQSAFISVVAEDETVGGAPDHQSYNPADGTFEVRNVPPGSYTLMADLPDWSPGFLPELDEAALQAMSPAERQRYFQTMEAAAINAEAERPRGVTVVTVGGEDVDGVVLRVARGASITGRIRVDGQAPGRAPAFGALRIALISRAPQLEWQPQQAIRPDGVFRIDSVPTAEYRLRVEGLPPGFYVKSARFGDVDALSASLRLPAEKPSALEIVLGSGVGQIEGTVTASTGRTVPGAAVVLIPDAGRSRPELFRMVTTGPGGEFRMSNIPPGNYHVVSWEFLDAYEYFDPALIQQAGQQGKAINVGSSSKQTVDLRAFAR
ncbi:MAG TPA: carboxypeptidase regulatory-like domain-containing protein, partial [Terriglobia bacterium]|nr:carboxypeptidase regulatory-like domain-containing protein [Terriglobia bacterium]